MAASFVLGTLLPPLAEVASSLAHSCLPPLVPGCLTLTGRSPERTEPCPIPKRLSLQALLKKGLKLYARSEIQPLLSIAGDPSLQPSTRPRWSVADGHEEILPLPDPSQGPVWIWARRLS